ncbi:HD domain-containing phosphohydrolase [Bacillus thuringiensis]|uniref:HD domain-containing phosphohydrolase n=1 Tax=Bacillus thuringiensis TaxID=1428 RepID=UPI0021D66B79|nr:HD domain-containing phosphohydrolase [Bacillus thuringiensis]MCU7668021.1 HD domain-containing protein [Bacillus thuringiensis]
MSKEFKYSIEHINLSDINTKLDLFMKMQEHNEGKTLEDSRFVANLNKAIAAELGWDKDGQERAHETGLYYDAGMVGLEPDFINFDGKFTVEMRDEMRKHVEEGKKLLEQAGVEPYVIEASEYHHRDFDGGGYGKEAKEKEIPQLARILRVTDSIKGFDNKGLSPLEALDDVKNPKWGNPYDTEIIDAYEKVHNRVKEQLSEKGITEPSLSEFKTVLEETYKVEIEKNKNNDKNNTIKLDKQPKTKKSTKKVEKDAAPKKQKESSYQKLKKENIEKDTQIKYFKNQVQALKSLSKEFVEMKKLSNELIETNTLLKEETQVLKKENEQLIDIAADQAIENKKIAKLDELLKRAITNDLTPEERKLMEQEYDLEERGHKIDRSLSPEERHEKVNYALLVENARSKEEKQNDWENKKAFASALLKTGKDLIIKPENKRFNENISVPKSISTKKMKNDLNAGVQKNAGVGKTISSFFKKANQSLKKAILHSTTLEKKDEFAKEGWSLVLARAASNASSNVKERFNKKFSNVSTALINKMSKAKKTFHKHLDEERNNRNVKNEVTKQPKQKGQDDLNI